MTPATLHRILRKRPGSSTPGRLAAHLSALLTAAILTSLAPAAHADEGPIVLGRRERPPMLTIDPWSGSVSLLTIMEYDRVKSNGTTTSSSSAIAQETLSLATGGGIVSKNFFDWKGSATVGLEENWNAHDSTATSGLGLVYAYNLNASFLNATQFPGEAYARRTESYTAASFQPLLKNTITEYGGTLNYNSTVVPTSVALYHTETQQQQLNGDPTFKLSEDHVNFQTAYDPSDRHHLDLNYEYVAIGQDNPGSILSNYETQNLAATHFWQIDSGGRYTLAENFNYNSQTGQFPFQHMRLGEQLRMRQSDTFDSAIDYSFDQQEFPNSLARTNEIGAHFSHRLFDSFTTTGQTSASYTTRSFSSVGSEPASTSDTTSYYANLAFNYSKKVPYGLFGANLSIGYNQTNNGAVGTTQDVNNDLETFRDPQPIVLTRPSINPSTIAVFTANGARQYVLNTDYTVSQVGNTIHIERVPFTSNIAPNETVLLNYVVDPLPAYTLSSTQLSTGARYDFTEGLLKGLGMYIQYTQQNQASTSSLIIADDAIDTVFGADYRIWKLALHAEHEDRESTLNAFNSTRFLIRYNDQLSARSNIALIAAQSFNEYPATNSTTNLTTFDARLDYQISRELRAIFSARWRNTMDSVNGNSMGIDDQGELRWTVRQTDIYFLIRHTTTLTPGTDSMGITAQFGITRNF